MLTRPQPTTDTEREIAVIARDRKYVVPYELLVGEEQILILNDLEKCSAFRQMGRPI